jgi:hypothetical protein
VKGFNYGLIRNNNCDFGSPLAIGICAQYSWWVDPYIAGNCCYSGTDSNNPGTQTFVVCSWPIFFFIIFNFKLYYITTKI